jgi:hypothetical protein
MTSPIDSIRRASRARRPRKTAADVIDGIEAGRTGSAEPTTLPVPVGPAKTMPAGSANASGAAAIHAQVLGERRGLKAGPTIHDQAKASYNQTEWSGTKDRRRPKGGTTKTDV